MLRRLVNTFSILIGIGLIGLALGATPASAVSIDFGVAAEYNTFILGNFSGSSDTQGKLAVGGNATLQHYSVGDQLPSNTTGNTLVVGGNLNYQGGRVYYGNVAVGGSSTIDQGVYWGLRNNGQTLTANMGASLPIDFTAAGQYLRNLSTSLATLAATGTATSQWGGMFLTGDGTSDLQVFYVDGALLSSATWWNALASIPSDAHILLNIMGKNVTMTGGQQVLASMSDRVLFNFYEAETLQIYGISVEGSILAPMADIIRAEGVIQGQLIAKSMTGSLQQNLNLYDPYNPGGGGGGNPPTAATPEPGSLLLLGSGLAALLGWNRRRRGLVAVAA